MHLKIIFKPFVCLVFFCFNFVNANDVHGCGGYIQSGVTINYSSVKIKLFSQQGNLKYETECAPNNGYYFLPIYDKGNYIVQVSPPPGWKFQPEKVEVNFNGETDICSQKKDINFNFQGFAVVGKVISNGSNSGPSGVLVTLKKDGQQILRTKTTEGGEYIFTPLASGIYIVSAYHDYWVFSKNEVTVIVKDSNGDAGKSLIIEGYEISGKSSLEAKYFKNIFVVLHGNIDENSKLGCISGSPSGYYKYDMTPIICHTAIKEDGSFTFNKIPNGRYIMTAFIQSEIEYQVLPDHLNLAVKHGDVAMTKTFSVTGGELIGKVLSGEGNGLKGVKIFLNGDNSISSDENGRFIFSKVQFGSHILSFVYDTMEFNDQRVAFSLAKPEMEPVKPAKFKTCFSMNLDMSSAMQEKWEIVVSHSGRKYKNVLVESNSRECLFLPSGDYTATVKISESLIKKGIRFGPSEHSFSVTTKPIENLRFSQFLGEIHGTVKCQERCPNLPITLKSVRAELADTRVVLSIDGKFSFKEIIPGDYQVSIDMDEWCWVENVIDATCDKKRVEVTFVQSGYRLMLVAAHQISLRYSIDSKDSGVIDVSEGSSKICMPSSGQYLFSPTGCHQILNRVLSWNTSAPKMISLAATHFKVMGRIESKEESLFSLMVLSSSGDKEIIKLESSANGNKFFPFEFWAADGKTVTLVPLSPADSFKFSPSSYNITMQSNCLTNAVTFVAERSLFLKGLINPPISDALAIIEEDSVISQYQINTEGMFVVGPLNRSRAYIVKPKKVGYVFKPPSYTFDFNKQVEHVDLIKVNFDAHKLAEIVVAVMDESGSPLEGVLVSTSGGRDYRQNSLTNENGTFVFHSLMANEYFLRPMMKEYDFEPSSKVVYVDTGKTVEVLIRAIRVAFSIYGTTYSISGEPENDIVLEAVSIGEKCPQLQEEATSDPSGMFRIRGLKPKCEYDISLKAGSSYRCIPKKSRIQMESFDLKDINLIVMKPFQQMDVAIIIATESKFLPQLSVEVSHEDLPDSVIHVVKVQKHSFIMLPPMVSDNKSYFVQLTSTLPKSKFDYVLPQVTFTANANFKKINLSFEPFLKTSDAEISKNTLSGFLLFIAAFLVVINYQKLIALFMKGHQFYTEKQALQPVRPMSNDTPHIEPITLRRRVKPRRI